MAAPTNYWKLGLFVVAGVILSLGLMVVLGARSLQQTKSVEYKSYFDESVQGLELGTPVKFRGVTVGNVSNIAIAADHRHVEVTSALGVDDLVTLGIDESHSRHLVPPGLRVQVASQGITGVKYILIDFFVATANPPPVLPFAAPTRYIPAAVSTMKNLEDAVILSVNRVPDLADQIVLLLVKVTSILEQAESKHLPDKAAVTLDKVDGLLTDIRAALGHIDVQSLSQQANKTLANLDTTVSQTNALLGRIQGERGVLRNAERASSAAGELAQTANALAPELEQTLRLVQEAAAAVQRLGDALDRDGDMLLKGRSKQGVR